MPTEALEQLADDGWPPLLVLQAPRGFGKTSAATWLLRQDADVRHLRIWVTLPSGHVSADQLWQAVLRRLRLRDLDPEDWTELQAILASKDNRLLVVIDRLDNCDLSVDEELAEVVREFDRVHVIAATRVDRPLIDHAALLDGVVLRCADFALDVQRAHELASLLDVSVSVEAIESLLVRVGGWPVILKLVLTRCVLNSDGHIVIDQSAIDRFVSQWWSELPAGARRGLAVLAVPEELSMELAYALVGADDLVEVEAGLADCGFIDEALDLTVSYPTAMRSALAAVFQRSDPDGYREVNAIAAAWFTTHPAPVQALRHAVAADDIALVHQLLSEHWSLLAATESDLVRQAIELLPDELIRDDVRLVVAREYVLHLFVDERASAAFHAGVLIPGESRHARLAQRLTVRESLTLRSRGLPEANRAMIEAEDLDKLIEASGWSDEVVQAVPQVLMEWSCDLLQRAPGFTSIYGFVEAFTWAGHVDHGQIRADAACGAALAHALVGHCVWAELWLDEVARCQAPSELGELLALLARAVIARDQLREPPPLDHAHFPPALADLEVVRLWVQASELIRCGRGREADRLLSPFALTENLAAPVLVDMMLIRGRVDAMVASGQLDAARALLLECDADRSRYPGAWAILELQSGNYEQVLTVDPKGLLPRQRIDLSIVQAKALLMLHQRVEAINQFQNVVGMTIRAGVRRPFALISTDTLAELAEGDLEAEELIGQSEITPLFRASGAGSRLSPREREVLQVVATGASFALVARQLFVSPNTVKSQMRIIYRKLGVAGRAEAVARAQELGLLVVDPPTGSQRAIV